LMAGDPVPSIRFPHLIALINMFFANCLAIYLLIYLVIKKLVEAYISLSIHIPNQIFNLMKL